MAVTTTTAANAIRETYEPGFIEAVWRNNSLLQHFPAPVMSRGDTSFRWKVNSAGNDSVEVFTEGLGQPDPGNQTWTNAAVAWTYFRAMVQVTGHARDALRSNWINAVDEDMILARGDLVDLITTSFMGSTYGLEVAVDSTTAYAGITRGAAAYWESTETAVGGALAVTDLEDILETIKDNDKGGIPGKIFAPLNQLTNIYRLTGTPAVQNIGDADKAPSFQQQAFAGIPIIGLPDFTNTVIMFLDMRPGKWVYAVQRPWDVKVMAPSGDSDVFQISYAAQLIDKIPKYDGKLTGVTA